MTGCMRVHSTVCKIHKINQFLLRHPLDILIVIYAVKFSLAVGSNTVWKSFRDCSFAANRTGSDLSSFREGDDTERILHSCLIQLH